VDTNDKSILIYKLKVVKYIKCIALLLSLQLTGMGFAQDRPVIKIPDILGYKTLKCDFHMHTIFSDGQVWPTVRIDEAWRDGIDAISITDHIEYRPNLKVFFKEEEFISDHNLPYEVAKEKANSKNILLIRGAEITRIMSPGHFNTVFLTDVNPLDTPWKDDGTGTQGWKVSGLRINNWKDAFYKAKNQGAFIIWNHPGWKTQQPDTTLWWQEHTWLFENHMMDGIEVVNGNSYSSEAHQWALDKNLTIIAGSDSHGPIGGGKRPVTLVFAKERNLNSIYEALVNHRTVIFYENKLIGDSKFLDAIFFSSITVESVVKTEEGFRIIIHNPTDIPFELSKSSGNDPGLEFFDKVFLPAGNYTTITIFTGTHTSYKKIDLKLTVTNLLTGPGKSLPVTITFITKS
jgi:3',5'-nucleoside bisphosphate phosphatase